MRVWVTGASGVVGTSLRRVLREGHEAVGISRRPPDDIVLDLADDEAGAALVEAARRDGAPDVVIHAAARKPGNIDPEAYVRDNVRSTERLLEALSHLAPRRLIYVSTLRVYGTPPRNPVSPDEEPIPADDYGATKRAAEKLVEAATIPERLVVRVPSLYGAGQEDSFIDGLARLALADADIDVFAQGATIRDALSVEAAAVGIGAAVEAPVGTGFHCFHLGTGEAVRTVDWANAIVVAAGSSSRVVLSDRPSPQAYDLWADISAAARTIGFRPPPLEESLRSYVAELRATS